MKIKLLLMTAAIAIAGSVKGDGTNTTDGTDTLHLLEATGKTLWQQASGLDLKGGLNVTPFGIVHDGDYGFGVAVSTIKTNGLSLGLALAAVDEKTGKITKGKPEKKFTFYDTTVSARWNEPATIPFVGIKVGAYLETGLAFDIKDPKTVYNQSMTGFDKAWRINPRTELGATAGIGYLTKPGWDKPFYLFGVTFTRQAGGKGLLGLF